MERVTGPTKTKAQPPLGTGNIFPQNCFPHMWLGHFPMENIMGQMAFYGLLLIDPF